MCRVIPAVPGLPVPVVPSVPAPLCGSVILWGLGASEVSGEREGENCCTI